MVEYFEQGHALIIGVGGDLPNTETDAKGLVTVLTAQDRCAYPKEQVKQLTGQKATRENILTGLRELSEKSRPGASVIIYFSGHGYRVSNQKGKAYYLMPFGYNPAQLEDTAISGTELTEALEALPDRKVTVLLDCCHAGGFGITKSPDGAVVKAPPGAEVVRSGLPPEALSVFAQGKGRVLLASARESELSYGGRPYSVFTLALIEALCGAGAAVGDGYVRFSDLAGHTREVVSSRTRGLQHPVMTFKNADDFVVAYYAGGELVPKAPPFAAEDIQIEAVPGASNPNPRITWNIGRDINIISGDKIDAQGNVYVIKDYHAARDVDDSGSLLRRALNQLGPKRSDNALTRVFDESLDQLDSLTPEEKPIVEAIIEQLRNTAEQIQQGDATQEARSTLQKWLISLSNFAPTIGAEVLTKLRSSTAATNPDIRAALKELDR